MHIHVPLWVGNGDRTDQITVGQLQREIARIVATHDHENRSVKLTAIGPLVPSHGGTCTLEVFKAWTLKFAAQNESTQSYRLSLTDLDSSCLHVIFMRITIPGRSVVRVIRKLEHSKKRLNTLLEKLHTVCSDTDPTLLEGIPALIPGPPIDFANLRSQSLEQLLLEALRSEDECRSLQGRANFLLQRLGTRAPELLQAFLAILDSSDTDSCTSCQSN